MTPVEKTEPWSPNWAELWSFGVRWTARPISGLLLPGAECSKIMTAVLEELMASYSQLPDEFQCHAFVQTTAVRLALEVTRKARLESGDPTLWHDASHRATTPALNLTELQRTDASGQLVSKEWTDLHRELKPRGLSFLRHEGVAEADAEDLFAEAMVGMVQKRKSGTAVIHDLVVYEQTPTLFLSILRRRLNNHIRHRHAEKRNAQHTVSLDASEDDAYEPTEWHAFNAWAADSADPFSGMTFARLAEECAAVLTPLQQRIMTALYIEESATYMEVASSAWFAAATQLKPDASSATRRRRLDHEHDTALDHLAASLGIERTENLQEVS